MTDLQSYVRAPLLVESPLSRYRSAGGERRLSLDHAILIAEGDGADASNLVAIFGPASWSELAAQAGSFFGGGAFEVVIESTTAADVEQELLASGWECVEEEVAMALTELPESPPAQPTELEIAPVTTPTAYEDYMAVVPGNRAWVPTLAAATDPAVGLFVGYVAGAPVATSRLGCYGAVAEVTGVQTLESHRRRGYGTAMTWAAIGAARHRGCTVVTLTATEMGYPIYLKMGFQEVCSYRAYEPA